jgi:hypothetical protein
MRIDRTQRRVLHHDDVSAVPLDTAGGGPALA